MLSGSVLCSQSRPTVLQGSNVRHSCGSRTLHPIFAEPLRFLQKQSLLQLARSSLPTSASAQTPDLQDNMMSALAFPLSHPGRRPEGFELCSYHSSNLHVAHSHAFILQLVIGLAMLNDRRRLAWRPLIFLPSFPALHVTHATHSSHQSPITVNFLVHANPRPRSSSACDC